MIKKLNKIVALIAALCVLVCMGALVACGDNVDTSAVTYTVTVNTGENSPAGNVKVSVGKGSASLGNKTTDSNGKAEFKLASDTYTVKLTNLPAYYQVPESANLTLSPESPDLTVTLEEVFAYRISLVNPDNTPFYAAGVTVGVCIENNCLQPVAIDQNGVAKIAVEKREYRVQILGLPDGYAYECDEHNYVTQKTASGEYELRLLTATVTEMTVTINPVNAVDPASLTPLSAAQLAEYKKKGLNIDGYAAYTLNADIAAKSTAYFAFKPQMDGEYKLYTADGASIAYKLNSVFLLGDSYVTGSGYFSKSGHVAQMNAGSTYYVNITNHGNSAATAEFVFSVPAATKTSTHLLGNVGVTLNEASATAYIEYIPAVQGKYTATVQGDKLAYIESVAYTDYVINPSAADYRAGCSAAVRAAGNYTNKINDGLDFTRVVFAVKVKDVDAPVTLEVKLEKTADIVNTVNVVQVPADLAVYNKTAAQNEQLTPVPIDGSAEIVEGDHGYYHYGTKTGPIVVVLLTKPIDDETRFSLNGSLAYLEMSNQPASSAQLGYIADVTPEADKAITSDKGNTYSDYRMALRGFNDYDSTPNMQGGNTLSIPKTVADKCYAKCVNGDGVYPLNAQLKAFLEVFAENINKDFKVIGAKSGYEWYFACYYYKTV